MLIILIAWLAYVISYLGRTDYSACMSAIIEETGVAQGTAGMVFSVFSLCNAFGQLAGGFVMRKVSPLKVIAAELFTVCIINLVFPMTNSFAVMAILWGINGVMQATLLSGMTQIFAGSLKEPYLSRGAVLMNTIGAVGGLFNYIFAAAMIRWFRWQLVFYIVSGLLAVLGVIWCLAMPKLAGPVQKKETKKVTAGENEPFGKLLLRYGTLFVILGGFFVGALRESVSLWVPTYMKNTFGLSVSTSTVITAVVPCVQISGAFLGGTFGRRSKTLHFPAAIAFILSLCCLLSIRFLGNWNQAVSIWLFAINAASMTAALTFLLSLFPVRYAGVGNIAVLVGVINFAVHGGDFAASYCIGSVSEKYGWDAALITLCGVAAAGVAVCLLGGIFCRKGEAKYDKARVSR